MLGLFVFWAGHSDPSSRESLGATSWLNLRGSLGVVVVVDDQLYVLTALQDSYKCGWVDL